MSQGFTLKTKRDAWKRTMDAAKAVKEQQEEMLNSNDELSVDLQYVFQIYATFCGDVERTAAATGMSAVDILRLANEDGWNDKLASIIKLKKSGAPGAVERAINRAMCFVQAHRLRLFLDRVVTRLTQMTEEQLLDQLVSTTRKTDKDGRVVEERTMLNTKPFADLSTALEKVHHMLYSALADSVSERERRGDDTGDEASNTDIHAAIAEAMAKVAKQDSVAKTLATAQLAKAEEQRKEAMAAGLIKPGI